jgi:ABC-type sugar transport system permease subunit
MAFYSRNMAGRRTVPPFWNNLKVVPYLFILPNMLLFLVFMIIPIFMTG